MLPLAALAAVPAIFQGISGLQQKRQANRMNVQRPTYTIPGALNESISMARQSAHAAIPGLGTAQNNILASTANAFRSAQMAGSGSNALAFLAAAQGNEANSMSNLAVQNAQFNTGQRANLQNQLGVLAGEQRNAWDWNHRQKFEDESAAKAGLLEAANLNIAGSLSGLSSVAMTAFNKPKKPQLTAQGTIPGFNPEGFYNGYRTA